MSPPACRRGLLPLRIRIHAQLSAAQQREKSAYAMIRLAFFAAARYAVACYFVADDAI